MGVDSLTNKDSIERSAPTMKEWKQDIIARSLNAIWGWMRPGLPCLFLFRAFGCKGLQELAMAPNPRTGGSMAQTSRAVQSAFCGQGSYVARESNASPAAQRLSPTMRCSEPGHRVQVAIVA